MKLAAWSLVRGIWFLWAGRFKPDHPVYLVFGNKQKLLKRHLAVEHDLNSDQHRSSIEAMPELLGDP